MSMIEWAEREIELACKREAPDRDPDEWDYGCACYESALKAFKCLAEDDHSGYSIGVTKQILNRLIEGKPLTPIEDTDDVWNEVCWGDESGPTTYQGKRMSSLFKDVYPDGTVKYNDVNRWVCVDMPSDIPYHSGLVDRTLNDMYPITMPYAPFKSNKVYCESFLVDPANGDFDTMGIHYFINGGGLRVDVNRYFTEDEDDWREINFTEFCSLKTMAEEKRILEEEQL